MNLKLQGNKLITAQYFESKKILKKYNFIKDMKRLKELSRKEYFQTEGSMWEYIPGITEEQQKNQHSWNRVNLQHIFEVI